jgi:hypothetical protein
MYPLEKRKFYRCITVFNDIRNQCQEAHELIEQQEFDASRKIIKEIYEKIIDLEQRGLPQEAIKECTIACAEIEKNWYTQICNTINDTDINVESCALIFDTIKQEKFESGRHLIDTLHEATLKQAHDKSRQLYHQLYAWADEIRQMHVHKIIYDVKEQCNFVMSLIENKKFNLAQERINDLYQYIDTLQRKGFIQEPMKLCQQLYNDAELAWYKAACSTIDASNSFALCENILYQIKKSEAEKTEDERRNILRKSANEIARLGKELAKNKERFLFSKAHLISRIYETKQRKHTLEQHVSPFAPSSTKKTQLERKHRDTLIEELEEVTQELYHQEQELHNLDAIIGLCDPIFKQIQHKWHLQVDKNFNMSLAATPEPVIMETETIFLADQEMNIPSEPDEDEKNTDKNTEMFEKMHFYFYEQLLAEISIKRPEYAKIVAAPAELKKRLDDIQEKIDVISARINKTALISSSQNKGISPEPESSLLTTAKTILVSGKKSSPEKDHTTSMAEAAPRTPTRRLAEHKSKRSIDFGKETRVITSKKPPRQPFTSTVYPFQRPV